MHETQMCLKTHSSTCIHEYLEQLVNNLSLRYASFTHFNVRKIKFYFGMMLPSNFAQKPGKETQDKFHLSFPYTLLWNFMAFLPGVKPSPRPGLAFLLPALMTAASS